MQVRQKREVAPVFQQNAGGVSTETLLARYGEQPFSVFPLHWKQVLDPAVLDPHIMAHAPFAVLVFDYRRQHYVYASANLKHLTGRPAEVLLYGGMRAQMEHVLEKDGKMLRTAYLDAFNRLCDTKPVLVSQARLTTSYRIRHDSGSVRWLLEHQLPLYMDANGAIVYGIQTLTDVTLVKNDDRATAILELPDENGALVKHDLAAAFYQTDAYFTAREGDVMQELVLGRSTKEISKRLAIKPYTVSTHRRRLLSKTNCKNTNDLIRYALYQGFAEQ